MSGEGAHLPQGIHKVVGHGAIQQGPGDIARLVPLFLCLMGRIILKV